MTAPIGENELKSSDFLNVAVYPEIRFVSHSVKPAGDDSADFSGDLTMKGVTRPETLHVVFQPSAGNGPLLIATVHLKRSSFNMTALSYLIDDEIEIQVKAALQEKK